MKFQRTIIKIFFLLLFCSSYLWAAPQDGQILQATTLVENYETAVSTLIANPTTESIKVFIAPGTLSDVEALTSVSYQIRLRVYNPFDLARRALDALQKIDVNAVNTDLQKRTIIELISRIATATTTFQERPEIGTLLRQNALYNRTQFSDLSQQAAYDETRFGVSNLQRTTYQDGRNDLLFLRIDPDTSNIVADLQKATLTKNPQDVSPVEQTNFERAKNSVASQWMFRAAQKEIVLINASILDPLKKNSLFLYEQFESIDQLLLQLYGLFQIQQAG